MPNKSAGVNPRNFNSMSVPGLSDEARKAVNTAFDAMSTWRIAGTATTFQSGIARLLIRAR